jgi:hypothetical protein
MKGLLTLTALVAALATAAPTALAARHDAQGYRFITDTLGGNGHPQQANGYRFTTDTLGGNGGAPLPAPTAAPGFDWTDAGVGAVTGVGAVFVLLGGTLLVARRRGQLAV